MPRSHFGSIQYISPGKYRIWWTDDGKRHSAYVSGSRDDAELALARSRICGVSDNPTWAEFYQESVVPTYSGLATKTVDDYSRVWNVELSPRIAAKHVSDMDWQYANAVLTSISAPTVQRRAGALLKKMCNIAVRRGLLSANPVKAINYAPHRPKPKRLVDCSGVYLFMERIEGIKYEAAILLMLGCGLRPEEALALTWEDIEPYTFAGRTYARVHINKALTNTTHGKELKPTKNVYSERDVIYGEPFASRILELSDGSSDPICPSGKTDYETRPENRYSSPVTVSHNWREWCKRHDVPYVTLENMRSSYATMMGEALVPDSIVDANMGHTPTDVKRRHYQNVTIRAKCMAADMLTDMLKDTLAEI